MYEELYRKIIKLMRHYRIRKNSHQWRDYDDAKYHLVTLNLNDNDYQVAKTFVENWVGV